MSFSLSFMVNIKSANTDKDFIQLLCGWFSQFETRLSQWCSTA